MESYHYYNVMGGATLTVKVNMLLVWQLSQVLHGLWSWVEACAEVRTVSRPSAHEDSWSSSVSRIPVVRD